MGIWSRIVAYFIAGWGFFNLLANRTNINRFIGEGLSKSKRREYYKKRDFKEWWLYTSVKHVIPNFLLYQYYFETFVLYPIEIIVLICIDIFVGTAVTERVFGCFKTFLYISFIINCVIERLFYPKR